MSYTVSNMLHDKTLDSWTSLTHGISLSRRPITAISVQELPFGSFVQEGELVLTTATGWRTDSSVFPRIIEEAAQARVSAVCFGFPDGIPDIPDTVIRRAEELDLPLFIIRAGILFAQVQARVNQSLFLDRVRPYTELQHQLFNAYFEGHPLTYAARLIAEALSCDVTIQDWDKAILATTGEGSGNANSFPIEINERLFGLLQLRSEKPLPEETGSVIHQYISYPLTLWFNQYLVEQATEARIRSDFVIRLAREPMSDALALAAGSLNIPLHKKYRAVLLEPIALSSQAQKVLVENTADIIREVQQIEGQNFLTVIAGAEMGRFLAFIECPAGEDNAYVHRFLEHWKKNIDRILPGARIHAGISQPFQRETRFTTAFEEASLALAYCSSDRSEQIYFEEARKLRIMSVLSGHRPIVEDAEKVLAGLLAYDRSGGSMELMKTLTTYIRNNYNTSETARALAIHRQSLLARLSRIEDLTGMSLKDHDDLLVLEIYTRLYRYY